MSTSAICSSLAAAACLIGVTPVALRAQLSMREALRSAFPAPAVLERRTAFLRPEDLAAIQAAAGSDVAVTQRVITYYVARRDGAPVGVAYFDSHRVRTLNEVLMIVVQPDDRIRGIEVLRFAEPPEYEASEPWLAQFEGKSLSQQLSLKGSIANMTGATLTSAAIVRASRRVLAVHGRIQPFGPKAGGNSP
ncbi:MAG: FMN-binding protein [Gemmatimonadales bacterium]|nr:FMN-binding protein [Gemmatimonadales bacterium]